ncbi:MAG: transcriptional regulator [Methanophagales archaeon]|nr:transcriptional regulator [Methanophagales archaeon]MCW7073024.1 transcriptional regulator [Methanophagales archaeon]
MKNDLIPRVIEILKEAGFIVSSRCKAKSFDLAARREDLILLAKVLYNIDGLNEEIARSIKRVAFSLLASPVVVGERKGSFFLEDDVVYHRHGIPAININTLYDYFIAGVRPYVYSATGGLYVNINGELMRVAREKKDLSLGDIASRLGVSRRSVSKYEGGGVSTTINIALKLEEILDTVLIEPLDFLAQEPEEPLPPEVTEAGIDDATSDLERCILGMMEEIGFEIFTTTHAPFNAVSLSQSSNESIRILTGISKYTQQVIKRARILSSLSKVTNTHSVFVVNGNVKRVQIDHTVLMEKEELRKIRDPEEFTCVIKEKMKDG